MTSIEWTDETWNPVVGCQRVAEGCRHCYAETMAKRLAKMGQPQYAAVVNETGWNGKAVTVPEALDKPLRWKRGRKIFVCSMSDLFHDDVPFEYIAAVFGVMAACPQHTFQVLTKRPERMLEFFEWVANADGGEVSRRCIRLGARVSPDESNRFRDGMRDAFEFPPNWPLPNVWLGTSVANQLDADKNIPMLLQVPDAIRFVSAEPLIGPVDLSDLSWREGCSEIHVDALHCDVEPGDDADWDGATLDWVIVGGESGPGARPCDVAWIRSIVSQCKAAGVPCFVKQVGSLPHVGADRDWPVPVECFEFGLFSVPKLSDRKGGDPAEWPDDLRVRQFPTLGQCAGVARG